MPAQIRLLLVDDHPVLRAGLESVINAHPGFCVVGGADHAQEAMRLFQELRPDVTLMDISMPEIDGIECTRRILAEFPKARILMLTSSDAEEDVYRALEAGALGYVFKTARVEELTEAIVLAYEGKRSISRKVEARLAERASGPCLTAREVEVLQYLRKGLSNAEIGGLLGISPFTAKGHVAALLKKLDAADRAEAVARAFERGVLKL